MATAVKTGNVCVSDKGLLFVFLGQFPRTDGEPGFAAQGMGFNGVKLFSINYQVVAENLNEYMQNTYGNNFKDEIAAS